MLHRGRDFAPKRAYHPDCSMRAIEIATSYLTWAEGSSDIFWSLSKAIAAREGFPLSRTICSSPWGIRDLACSRGTLASRKRVFRACSSRKFSPSKTVVRKHKYHAEAVTL